MTDKIENILFDLDGTLTDPKEGIVNSILYALDKMGIHENSPHELDSFIGPPLLESFQMRYDLDTEKADEIVIAYREYFSTKGLFENILYDGIAEVLESLHTQKYKLFVATSKPTVYSEQILEHFDLKKYFTEIIGSNVDNTRTDKTEIIAHVISTHGLQANKSIMIGDTKFDMIGAKNNSLKTVGVTYGYGSQEDLKYHNPDYIVNTCAEIRSIFVK